MGGRRWVVAGRKVNVAKVDREGDMREDRLEAIGGVERSSMPSVIDRSRQKGKT